MADRRLWTPEEDQLINDLVHKYGTKKWIEIAHQMKQIYPHLARSSKQIRQRWHNHLDPSISREPWSPQEQAIVFDAHRKIGSRWKQIAKMLSARTDNSVKNHFYSTLRRSLRRMNKFLGSKNSTNQMKVLKPTILGKLIEQGQNNQQARVLINGIFQFSKFKPNKANNKESNFLSPTQKQFLHHALQKLMEFNDKYNPLTRKMSKKQKNKFPHNLIQLRGHKQDTLAIAQRKDVSETEDLSSKQNEGDDYESQMGEIVKEQQNWEDSQIAGYRGLLPQLEHPQCDQSLLQAQCKIQQFFI